MEAGFFLPGEGSEPEALSPVSEAGPLFYRHRKKCKSSGLVPGSRQRLPKRSISVTAVPLPCEIGQSPMTIDGGVCRRAQREALAVGEYAARYGGRQANPVWNMVPVLSAAASTAGVAYLAYLLA